MGVEPKLTIEVRRMPRINEDYSLTTWIEGFNRHFSERNFELRASGVTIGYMRTVWVAINVATRRPADLSGISHLQSTVSDRLLSDRAAEAHPVTSGRYGRRV